MELSYGLARSYALLRYDVLTCIVAFLRAGPEEKAAVESYGSRRSSRVSLDSLEAGAELLAIRRTDGSRVIIRIAILTDTDLL